MCKYLLLIRHIFVSCITIVFLASTISAQGSNIQEEGQSSNDAANDTTELIQVTSKLYWYNIERHLSLKSDSSRYEIHRLSQEKKLIYMDMSDIFRSQPLWFDFDLIEPGRPAFISLTNTYPHQTSLFLGGTVMNDYLQGSYNTQFIPLNYIQFAEKDYTIGGLQNYSLWSGSTIHITPHSIHTQRPWTKILYKQGSYGYSDVDIHFEVPFSSTFAVQLGGKNSGFDGLFQGSGFDGQNYRAEVTWQYSPQWYFRGQMFLNRNKVGLAAFDPELEFGIPAIRENRDDYFLDVTWVQNDSLRQRLHLLFYYSNYWRKYTETTSNFIFNTYSERYGLDANYNFLFGTNELLVGASTLLSKIWGDPFNGGFTSPALNAYGKLKIPLTSNMHLRAALQAAYIKDFDISLLPNAGLDIFLSQNSNLSVDLTNGQRVPNVTERFFDFDTLYGNNSLTPETYSTINGKFYYAQINKWHLKIDAGYHRIENEIVWKDSVFLNQNSRDFMFCGVEGLLRIWWFDFTLAGQYTFADVNLTPTSSIWGEAHFNWVLLNGALIVDAIGTLTWYDKHQAIKYHPKLDRFHTGLGITESFLTLSWKIAATFQSAHVFFEMDNALQETYEIVSGYTDFYRRFRLGINWTLWD
jgi:outer membrane cobalamin receptor